MKQILTHKSRSIADVIELLKHGTFTCPTLPHYRYRITQQARSVLIKAGMITPTGRTDEAVNYKPTDKFKEWRRQFEEGLTKLQPVKWAKEQKKGQSDETN